MAEETYEVDHIIGRRTTSDGKEDYLVRWQSYSPLQSTWEPINNFTNCQRAILEFFDQHWPIPGSQATSVVHLEEKPKPVQVKQELVSLQALPTKKGKKFLRGLRKDLKDEILRLQLETKSSNATIGEPKPLFTAGTNLEQSNMVSFNGASPKHSRRLEVKKTGMKRSCDVDSASKNHELSSRMSTRNTPRYISSLKEKYKKQKKSPHSKAKEFITMGKPRTVNGISSSQKDKLVDDASAEKISIPTRLTRHNLTNILATCILEEELAVTEKNGCMYIKLCNGAKKNVISLQMCEDMISALHNAGKEDISVVVITGSGSTFTYGWDLDQFKKVSQTDRKDLVQKYRLLTRMLVTCPKPLIAAVNGPAAGFGVALAGLCDLVLASDKATFQTMFAEWGHPPVGCCSQTLPHLIGTAKAMSMLLLNNKFSAPSAEQIGLVSQVLDSKHFDEQLESNIQRITSVPTQCLKDTKSILHETKVQELANVNEEECDFFVKYISDSTLSGIVKRWQASIDG